jgi:serine protease Do
MRTGSVILILLLLAGGLRTVAAADPPRTIEDLARRVRDSIATIRFTGRGGDDQGLGTGFVVAADGLIATNLHVIGEARPITVELSGGRRHDVTAVHASDREADLAIVRIDARDLPVLPLGDPSKLVDGQEVVAVGNPHGLERSVVAGRVSSRRRMEGLEMIQLAIPIEPGNSGGPLLDLDGRVHGVLTLKSLVTPNLGFAVSVDRLQPLLDRPNPVSMDRWLTIGALDPKEWTPVGGARWRQRAGRLSVAGTGQGFGGRSLCLAVEPAPAAPFDVAAWVKLDDEAGAAGLVFASDGGDRHYGFYPSNRRLRLTRFDGPDVFSWKVLEEKPSPAYRIGDWNHLRVRLTADRIECFVNDMPVFATEGESVAPGRVGLAKFRDTAAEFRGFAVAADLPPALPPAEFVARIAKLTDELPAEGPPTADLVARVLPEGRSANAALAAHAAALERQAAQVRKLAAAVDDRRTLEEFTRAVTKAEADIDLFAAALLVAKLDNPELDVDAYGKELERLAADVTVKLPKDADEAAKLATLNRVLFTELGFHGSRGDYYNRSNSYVNEVLDDREGIPITLSVVYMELARHLGLRVQGVGFPGHFLVKYEPQQGEPQWLDVFDGATPLSRDELRTRLREDAEEDLADEHLAVVGTRAILTRMLNNLLNLAGREEEPGDMLRYLDAMLVLAPDSARDRVLRMVTSYRLGRRDVALADARWLLEHAPEGIDLDQVRRMLEMLEAGTGPAESPQRPTR